MPFVYQPFSNLPTRFVSRPSAGQKTVLIKASLERADDIEADAFEHLEHAEALVDIVEANDRRRGTITTNKIATEVAIPESL